MIEIKDRRVELRYFTDQKAEISWCKQLELARRVVTLWSRVERVSVALKKYGRKPFRELSKRNESVKSDRERYWRKTFRMIYSSRIVMWVCCAYLRARRSISPLPWLLLLVGLVVFSASPFVPLQIFHSFVCLFVRPLNYGNLYCSVHIRNCVSFSFWIHNDRETFRDV